MLGVILNGQERLVREGVSILEAARSAGVEIPSLCFHRGLKPSGACRLCVVEVEGWESYAAACTTEVAQGMRVQTHSEGGEAMRQTGRRGSGCGRNPFNGCCVAMGFPFVRRGRSLCHAEARGEMSLSGMTRIRMCGRI